MWYNALNEVPLGPAGDPATHSKDAYTDRPHDKGSARFPVRGV